MTDLTEQQQRIVYEWLRPELKGKDWTLLKPAQHMRRVVMDAVILDEKGKHWIELPCLYNPDGTVNYNPWHNEVMTKLSNEGFAVNLEYGDWILARDGSCNVDTDPWLALVEMLEVK